MFTARPEWDNNRLFALQQTPRRPQRWSYEQAGLLDLLASRGADLNKSSETGTTLAHIAALNDDSGCLKVLCERGADVDAVDQYGNTPIMFAAMTGGVHVSGFFMRLSQTVSLPG